MLSFPIHLILSFEFWSVFYTVGSASMYSTNYAAAAAKSLQSCPTLCDPIDGSPPGSPVPGILQARTLEWVASSFSTAWKWKVKVKLLSHVWLFTTPWTVAYQAPPSMGFSRQEYWSGLPLPSPQPIMNSKYSEKIFSESFREQNLNLRHASNYLNSIYIVFTTIYIELTLY